jgi:2-polyprenyl-6-methoxyphenol hydroxylase-like FAD-dependent oxidoreductase
MNTSKKLASVGGGIGGLTLAIALQRRGYSVTLYEQAGDIRPVGAGLVLAANAMKAFAALGIDKDILDSGKMLRSLLIKDETGAVLTATDAESVSKKFGAASNFAIHRADLHHVLSQHIEPGTIVLGKVCKHFEQTPIGISLLFEDGSVALADYIIASDGIHSIFRKQLVENSTPRYAGYTCWRAVIDNVPAKVNRDETSETWGPGARFGIVPLAHDRLYWFACVNAPFNSTQMRQSGVHELRQYFKAFHEPIQDILQSTTDDQLIWGDIVDLRPLNRFAFDNIVLMGDAAHATTPNMGQGACMAVEDAVILSNCMANHDDFAVSFREFESKRLMRTRKITTGSWRIGRVAQWRNPLLVKLRNAVVRATPPRVTEKQMHFLYDITFQ